MTNLAKAAVLSALLALTGCKVHFPTKSIVKLTGNDYSCTGYQIEAPSGKNYLITAGHCAMLLDSNLNMEVHTEDGATLKRHIIDLDTKSDLMLLEPLPGVQGFKIAKSDYRGEFVVISGYGYGLPAWEVSGNIICDEDQEGGFGAVLGWRETLSTAGAVPGHSGSPVLDQDGNTLGVLSTSNTIISGFVRLSDLQTFLKGY